MTRVARATLIAVGGIAVALGVVGMIVPGMPTTVFLIVASYCFARSSPALDAWLHNHRWFGAGLRRFRETGGMPRRAKVAALLSMWAGVSLSLLLLGSTGRLVVLALAIVGTATIAWGVKSIEPTE